MSTKINARSPYFLKVEPVTVDLGEFICELANLTNFAVSSEGLITEPNIQRGTIISASDDSFAVNNTGSPIPRTVTYTIRIPFGYTNYSSSTINCDVTADQPSQTAQQTSPTCPTVDANISNIVHTSLTQTTTVDLTTKFSAGTGDSISKYELYRISGSGLVTGSISGSTLTHTTPVNCTSATFRVAAFNSDNSCNKLVATYTVSGPCAKALTCLIDDANNVALNITGGAVDADGTIHNPLTSIGNLQPIRYERPIGTTITQIDENTSGSDTSIGGLVFVYEVPAGFSNAGGAPLKCVRVENFIQPSTAQPRALVCSDVILRGVSVTSSGAINTVGAKVYIKNVGYDLSALDGWVRNADGGSTFPIVATQTPRAVKFNLKAPTSEYTNHNQYISVDCDATVYQAPADICGTLTAYLSNQAFTDPSDICGDLGAFEVNVPHQFNVSSFAQIGTGDKVCLNGTPKNGNNRYFVLSQSSLSSTADAYSTWYVIKIDRDGNTTENLYHSCEGDI